jgi:hypothetical protein
MNIGGITTLGDGANLSSADGGGVSWSSEISTPTTAGAISKAPTNHTFSTPLLIF